MLRKIRLFCFVVAAVALAGCSSTDDSQKPFGLQEGPSPTSVAAAPYAVPATIDKEYVGRVIARLERRARVRPARRIEHKTIF